MAALPACTPPQSPCGLMATLATCSHLQKHSPPLLPDPAPHITPHAAHPLPFVEPVAPPCSKGTPTLGIRAPLRPYPEGAPSERPLSAENASTLGTSAPLRPCLCLHTPALLYSHPATAPCMLPCCPCVPSTPPQQAYALCASLPCLRAVVGTQQPIVLRATVKVREQQPPVAGASPFSGAHRCSPAR